MKPVLISGAGLGGCLLAKSLRSSGIPFELFERDASVSARGQGYRIRISKHGVEALKSVLTEEEFQKFLSGTSETGGGGIHGLDAISGESVPSPIPGPSSKGEDQPGGLGGGVLGVARGFLRGELVRGLQDAISWNHKVTGYERTADSVRLIFADGTKSSEGSLLIAADGPQSSITRQLTDGKVRALDTGARMIHGQTKARAFKELGDGVWSVSDKTSRPGTTLGLITNVRPGSLDEPDLELGWVFVGSPGSFDAPNGDFSVQGKVAADLSRELTAKWHPKLRVLFTEQNDAEAAFLKMSTGDPQGVPKWNTDTRVSLLGDAVHCMTPAGGVGANGALKDAALIGKLLADNGGWFEALTAEYEEQMRIYASESVKISFELAAGRFGITELK